MIAKISLALMVVAFTAGSALAECPYKKRISSAPPPAQAATVDVATLLPPVPAKGTKASAETTPPLVTTATE